MAAAVAVAVAVAAAAAVAATGIVAVAVATVGHLFPPGMAATGGPFPPKEVPTPSRQWSIHRSWRTLRSSKKASAGHRSAASTPTRRHSAITFARRSAIATENSSLMIASPPVACVSVTPIPVVDWCFSPGKEYLHVAAKGSHNPPWWVCREAPVDRWLMAGVRGIPILEGAWQTAGNGGRVM